MDKFSAFQMLGLDLSAKRGEVKAAFRSLAKTCHPDRFSGRPGASAAEERMKRLNQAFELLMRALPEEDGQVPAQKPPKAKPDRKQAPSMGAGLFSAFRKQAGKWRRSGGKNRAHASRKAAAGANPAGMKRGGSGSARVLKKGPVTGRKFASVLSSTVAGPTRPASAEPGVFKAGPGKNRGDAYARYVRLKHRMQVQRRRPGQAATVSRVERISPVRPVPGSGEK